MHAIKQLTDLAEQINEEHRLGCRDIASGFRHWLNAGDLLLQVRDQCAHGEWLPWLKANFEADQKTAWNYMELARHREAVEMKLGTVPNLSLRAALKLARPQAKLAPPPPAPQPLSTQGKTERPRRSPEFYEEEKDVEPLSPDEDVYIHDLESEISDAESDYNQAIWDILDSAWDDWLLAIEERYGEDPPKAVLEANAYAFLSQVRNDAPLSLTCSWFDWFAKEYDISL